MVRAQRARSHQASRVDPYLLEQRRAERLRHAALDLAAQLHRVDHGARVHGLHGLQDADLPGLGPDRHPEPLRGERHRPGQPVAVALRLQRLPAVRRLAAAPLAAAPCGDRLGERPGGPHRGGPRDHDARGPVRARVVAGRVGVGGDHLDVVRRAAQHARGELTVHRRGAVAEFGGPDEEPVPSVRPLRDPGPPVVAARRDGVQHGHRDAGPGQPAVRRSLATAARQGLLHQVEALERADALGADIRRLPAAADQFLSRPDEVAAAELGRIDACPARQFVDGGLDREHGLGQPVAAERPGGERVRVDRVGVYSLVRAAVGGDRLFAAVEQHARAMVAVGAGVGQHRHLEGGQRAVAGGAEPYRDLHRVPGAGGGELLLAGEL